MPHIIPTGKPTQTDRPASGQVMARITDILSASGVMPRDFATVCHLLYGRGFAELRESDARDLLDRIGPHKGSQPALRDWIVRTVDDLTSPAGLV